MSDQRPRGRLGRTWCALVHLPQWTANFSEDRSTRPECVRLEVRCPKCRERRLHRYYLIRSYPILDRIEHRRLDP
jgi:hypothetical protein